MERVGWNMSDHLSWQIPSQPPLHWSKHDVPSFPPLHSYRPAAGTRAPALAQILLRRPTKPSTVSPLPTQGIPPDSWSPCPAHTAHAWGGTEGSQPVLARSWHHHPAPELSPLTHPMVHLHPAAEVMITMALQAFTHSSCSINESTPLISEAVFLKV